MGDPIMRNPAMVNWRAMTQQAWALLDELGIEISARSLIRNLGWPTSRWWRWPRRCPSNPAS